MAHIIRTVLVLLAVCMAFLQATATPNNGTNLPCDNPTMKSAVFCNSSEPIEVRLADLMRRLTTDDFPTFLSNNGLGAESIAMPPYQWWSEGLHGVADSAAVFFTPPFSSATSFPQVCTTAASFNTTLFRAVGDTIGREGRAMANFGHAGLTYWAPNVNIFRDPRWGRGQETPGEDPLLNSRYGLNFVQGMQNNSMDPTRLRVSGCCKHFLAYDMEDSDGDIRYSFNAQVSEYDLQNTYLVAFESCLSPAGGAASGLMCSYNAINGVPACANQYFMTDVARGQWGFNGYITSDCGATGNVYRWHHYTTSEDQTVGVTLAAGEDLDCGYLLSFNLLQAIANGNATSAEAVHALNNTFRVLFRLGYFDPWDEQPYRTKLGPQDVNTPEAQELAIDAARQGIVLLNYNTSYLPLDANIIRHVAVMGNNANNSVSPLGNYHGTPPYVITALQGIQQQVSNVSFLEVLSTPTDMNTTFFPQACQLAKTADTTVLVIGIDQSVEAEGLDRTSIDFPGNQNFFVETVANCAFEVEKRITVVAYSGGSLDYSFIRKQPGVGALLWAGYPGQGGGKALAEILFGVVSPSGRVPTTIYPASFVNEVQMINMDMSANATTGSPGFTYRYYTGKVVYPFGWGLTYTNWSLIPVHWNMMSAEEMDAALATRRTSELNTELALGSLVVNITNTGTRSSAFTLLYKISYDPPGPVVGGTLSDFQKVFLEPGQSTLVTLNAVSHAISTDGGKSVRRGMYRGTVNEELAHTFTI